MLDLDSLHLKQDTAVPGGLLIRIQSSHHCGPDSIPCQGTPFVHFHVCRMNKGISYSDGWPCHDQKRRLKLKVNEK